MEDQAEQKYLCHGRQNTQRVARKVGLYVLEVISLWECSFWTSEIVYDSIPSLGLSLQSPIEFIQKSCDSTQVNNT